MKIESRQNELSYNMKRMRVARGKTYKMNEKGTQRNNFIYDVHVNVFRKISIDGIQFGAMTLHIDNCHRHILLRLKTRLHSHIFTTIPMNGIERTNVSDDKFRFVFAMCVKRH